MRSSAEVGLFSCALHVCRPWAVATVCGFVIGGVLLNSQEGRDDESSYGDFSTRAAGYDMPLAAETFGLSVEQLRGAGQAESLAQNVGAIDALLGGDAPPAPVLNGEVSVVGGEMMPAD
jgi:hypothetical protein